MAKLNSLNEVYNSSQNLIDDLTVKIAKLENQNQIQAQKIKELASKTEHEVIEYENDGLPKQTKENFKRRKGFKK